MSAEFDLALIGAPLKLWISSSSYSVLLVISVLSFMLLCFFEQSLNLGSQSVSMRLRSKRTCCGVKCFGGFHIKQRFIYLFLFLRGDFT